jgi:hypothetical protein
MVDNDFNKWDIQGWIFFTTFFIQDGCHLEKKEKDGFPWVNLFLKYCFAQLIA